jgi:hypothetical protein
MRDQLDLDRARLGSERNRLQFFGKPVFHWLSEISSPDTIRYIIQYVNDGGAVDILEITNNYPGTKIQLDPATRIPTAQHGTLWINLPAVPPPNLVLNFDIRYLDSTGTIGIVQFQCSRADGFSPKLRQ